MHIAAADLCVPISIVITCQSWKNNENHDLHEIPFEHSNPRGMSGLVLRHPCRLLLGTWKSWAALDSLGFPGGNWPCGSRTRIHADMRGDRNAQENGQSR